MSAVTQWFDGAIKPAHHGVYECTVHESTGQVVYAWFNGRYWESYGFSVRGAWERKDDRIKSNLPYRKWRGLAVKP
jgi:hypothetical protein